MAMIADKVMSTLYETRIRNNFFHSLRFLIIKNYFLLFTNHNKLR